MAHTLANNAKLEAARDLLRILIDRKKDDAGGIAEKAILNSSINLIDEVIDPTIRPTYTFNFGPSLSSSSKSFDIVTPTMKRQQTSQQTAGGVGKDETQSKEGKKPSDNSEPETPSTPRSPAHGYINAGSDAGHTPFAFGPKH